MQLVPVSTTSAPASVPLSSESRGATSPPPEHHVDIPGSSATEATTAVPAADTEPVTSQAAPTQPEPDEATRPQTRLQSGIRKPKVYTDGTIKYGCLFYFIWRTTKFKRSSR